VKQLTFQGFRFSGLLDMPETFRRNIIVWVNSGQMRYREDIVQGLANAPEAFTGLFRGTHFGKPIVEVAADAP